MKGIFNEPSTYYLLFHGDNLPFYYVAHQTSRHNKRVTFPRQYLILFFNFSYLIKSRIMFFRRYLSNGFLSLSDRRMMETVTKFITVISITHLEQLHISTSETLTINIWWSRSKMQESARTGTEIHAVPENSGIDMPSLLNKDRRILPFWWFPRGMPGIVKTEN